MQHKMCLKKSPYQLTLAMESYALTEQFQIPPNNIQHFDKYLGVFETTVKRLSKHMITLQD